MFWKENATKLNDKDHEQLKYVGYIFPATCIEVDTFLQRILVRLLKESEDAVILAVAAHDLGQYVKHYERGKKCVSSSIDLFSPLTLIFTEY